VRTGSSSSPTTPAAPSPPPRNSPSPKLTPCSGGSGCSPSGCCPAAAELTLFDVTPIPPPEKISPDRRRTARQRALIAAGIHPLMGGPTHPDRGTCGTCTHRIHISGGGRTWPKCDLHELTHGPGSDCRAWWAACGRYEPGDRVSDDAARWTPNHAHR
jgi:hypothetical protein